MWHLRPSNDHPILVHFHPRRWRSDPLGMVSVKQYAIRIANDSRYGLHAAVLGTDLQRAPRGFRNTGRRCCEQRYDGPTKTPHLLQAKLVKHGTLKIYPGFAHGMTTPADF